MQRLGSILPSGILIILWTYTGIDKLVRFEESRIAFLNQTFPTELSEILSYAIPGVELFLAILLLFSTTRWWGFLGTILLMSVFLTYVGLIWTGAFPRVPCNCAGIFESLGWAAHFRMNSGFIILAIWGMWSERRAIVEMTK